jgi:hypothetical protein
MISMYSFLWIFGGQPVKNISSQLPPLDDSREKGLRLPSRKLTSLAEIVPVPSLTLWSLTLPSSPLYTPFVWKHSTGSMEVDFQAIKVEDLKSRLGELRRYL